MMEFHEQVNGVDYRKSSFILISSSGGKEVNDVTIEKQGIPRHELHVKDFEKKVSNQVLLILNLSAIGYQFFRPCVVL